MGSHLGRTFAGAYGDDGECSGGFGVEVGALAWPAVSSGAAPVMALRWSSTASVALASGGRRERGTGNRANGAAWEPGLAS